MSDEIFEYIAFGFVLFSFVGAFISSNSSPSRKQMFTANAIYLIPNIFGIIFMIYFQHWAYLMRNVVFLLIAIRGIINNWKKEPIKFQNIEIIPMKGYAEGKISYALKLLENPALMALNRNCSILIAKVAQNLEDAKEYLKKVEEN